MSDEPTQPATQPVLDPRRLGRNNSGLNDEDIADVLLILHPATPTAIKIVELAAETRPEHVLFRRNSLDSMSGSLTDIEEQETIIINASGERVGHGSRAGADLALRMSSVRNLRFRQLGFIFGRNPNSADIVFGQDTGKRISNQHFRIYLNSDGIIMIEDMSTNGTIVDDQLLSHKMKRFNKIRMLSSGSIISIQNSNESEMIRFIVRIPARVSYMDRFRDNLRHFITECAETGNKEKALQRISKQCSGPSMKWDGGANYNLIGQIGKGAFATVHQLATKMEGKLLAAKELEKRRFMKNGQLDKKIDNEMKIMQSLRHPNVVEFVEYHDQGDYLYIIMEFVRCGDLQAYLHQQGPLKESLVRTIAQQILSALNYLHRSKITHRDIKPDNILIADLDPFTVKLSDFGLSKVVKHDETFLKTFCGTLLYCAPEVFPEYSTGPSKGTKRRRGTKQYHSYSSSVDIWSFGGVLWYCLCGQPPFKGIADATGEAMFNNIMATPLDPSPLQKAGVSAPCIDLLTRMLRTDPATRPTDRECLNHPWLKEGAVLPVDPTLQAIAEEDESQDAEDQLSQLHIQEEIPESDEESDILSDDELIQLVNPKRIRPDPRFPRDQLRDATESSIDASFQPEHFIDDDESFRLMPAPGRARLFGEIGQSALQSSGILNAHATNALSEEEAAAIISRDGVQSFSHAVGGTPFQGPFTAPSQLDGGLSSPSLLGAESLVREMNMTSPYSPVSGTHTPGPTTPRTPEVVQHNSLTESSKEFSQISEPTPKARAPGLNRQISLPLTASYYYDPLDPSTHNAEYASKVSGYDFLSAGRDLTTGTSVYEDTVRASDTSSHSEASHTGVASSPSAEVPCVPAELDIELLPKHLGKLVATADSFAPNLTLNIDRSKTSWGRFSNNTIVYEDRGDTRIPKTAFIIFWYSSGGDRAETVQELSQKGKDWTSLKELNVGIWTCATHGISINGKHLRQKDERGRALFGHLNSGDIIQVYHDPNGTTCMKFRCEFYIGTGRQARKAEESFQVRVGNKLGQENFWALPAVLRIAVASQHAFSVFDDLLAFPQYAVVWPDTFIAEDEATALLAQHAPRSSGSAPLEPQETQELSKRDPLSADTPPTDDALEQTYEAVVLGGQRYLCSIPTIPEEVPQNSTTTAEEAKAEEEKELMRATDRGWELLEGMKGNCIYYLSGWWSYSFCYKDEVKQFHQLPPSRGIPMYPPVEDTSVWSFVLGRYPKDDKRKTLGSEQGTKETFDDEGNMAHHEEKGMEIPRLESKGSSRYMVQQLSGGTQCDLTGKDRKIDVQFHCNPQSADRIAMIKETSTCSYLMIVDTPRLCNDIAFQPPQENLAHPISCRPVVPASDLPAWETLRLEAQAREADRLAALKLQKQKLKDAPPGALKDTSNPLRDLAQSAKRIVIGGIEVGAHQLVGSEGKVIEKSVVVGGGKETFLGTVASSDGSQMTAEQMRELMITDPKAVEKLKANLDKLAGRKGWKLDLVDTPRGREFRGIIEVDEEEKGKKGKGEKKDEDKAVKGGEGEAEEEYADEEEDVQEGSEEVYKDEL
ncbi:Pkinase-domain-containing protein [Dothidotthia symphoricarpi CBS 119687]|uniref:Autophagy-related protein 1 n=1 Tax=Dothidotthia symphoricarpi CBS 119687 TaxID=1392245 RepID=A0A6A6APE8_9PLEO|nr:Pkinase-domain-containing protein [Dothidotthia symphoricarpi CBS 119687]KAF2133063.1 Pkinase-domain-containing protein [Dothidotthia symphoricarpi CBS 119687]